MPQSELQLDDEVGLVGARGFEPPTSSSRTMRATKLRHAPTVSAAEGRGMIAHPPRPVARPPLAQAAVAYVPRSFGMRIFSVASAARIEAPAISQNTVASPPPSVPCPATSMTAP